MAVKFKNPQVQVWDGESFSFVSMTVARKLEKAGSHQITTDLPASQLKLKSEFKVLQAETPAKPKYETKVTESSE